jgi:hypothetical protein
LDDFLALKGSTSSLLSQRPRLCVHKRHENFEAPAKRRARSNLCLAHESS